MNRQNTSSLSATTYGSYLLLVSLFPQKSEVQTSLQIFRKIIVQRPIAFFKLQSQHFKFTSYVELEGVLQINRCWLNRQQLQSVASVIRCSRPIVRNPNSHFQFGTISLIPVVQGMLCK